MHIPIRIDGRTASLRKSYTSPDLKSNTVLVSDPWEYVSLWLRRKNQSDALFYWEQGQAFFAAFQSLPTISAPLPGYYAILNATKALLTVRGAPGLSSHGVHGKAKKTQRGRPSLCNELIFIQSSGVLPRLLETLGHGSPTAYLTGTAHCIYCKSQTQGSGKIIGSYNLKDLLYNLVFIHRAYNLTFRSSRELFIPIKSSVFVRKEDSHEAWFEAEIDPKYANIINARTIPDGFERDKSKVDSCVIRSKQRFTWTNGDASDIGRLIKKHGAIRKTTSYIYGPMRLWYFKKKSNSDEVLDLPSMGIIFAAMHRLSELARYDPLTLQKHFNSSHNWLLTEFIDMSVRQFVDEISAELTGQEFMVPGIATR